jgi:hypothetical protein
MAKKARMSRETKDLHAARCTPSAKEEWSALLKRKKKAHDQNELLEGQESPRHAAALLRGIRHSIGAVWALRGAIILAL